MGARSQLVVTRRELCSVGWSLRTGEVSSFSHTRFAARAFPHALSHTRFPTRALPHARFATRAFPTNGPLGKPGVHFPRSSGCKADVETHMLQNASTDAPTNAPPDAPPDDLVFCSRLSDDLWDAVLCALPSLLDVLALAKVCRRWQEWVRTYYLRHGVIAVAPPGDLKRTVDEAAAGSTIRFAPGLYQLASTLVLSVPLRLEAAGEAPAGSEKSVTEEAAAAGEKAEGEAAGGEEAGGEEAGGEEAGGEEAGGETEPKGAVVLVSSQHILLWSRAATASLVGLTLCRTGDEDGHPNAVVYAEQGILRMDRCRVTCSESVLRVTDALRAFVGIPEPGSLSRGLAFFPPLLPPPLSTRLPRRPRRRSPSLFRPLAPLCSRQRPAPARDDPGRALRNWACSWTSTRPPRCATAPSPRAMAPGSS